MNAQILKSLLDRPVAFHACLAHLTGSVNSGLLLSQAIYWSNRTKDSAGWFWKTQTEWFDETALTRRAQEVARRELRETSFWMEREDRYAHKLFFRVDMENLATALSKFFSDGAAKARGGSVGQFDEWRKPPSANGGKVHPRMAESAIPSTSETTSQRLLDPRTPLPEKPADPKNAPASTPPEEAKPFNVPNGAIMPANGNDPWKAIKAELQKSVNPRSWESWIRPTRLAYTLDGKLFVTVPSGEFGDWIPENFGPAIAAAKQALNLEFAGIEFVEGTRGS